MSFGEGGGTVSDNSGNLLFYSNGVDIRNALHATMANGLGIAQVNTATQTGMIVKQPGNNNLYYIFTTAVNALYTIVDMSLAAGLGSVTVKGYTIYTNTTERQTCVRHCNGRDVWILNHELGSANFRAYLLDASGLSINPVISTVGEPINTVGGSNGQLKISPDGKKLAMAVSGKSTPTIQAMGGFQIFDFNAATGQVSNFLSLDTATYAYGMEFSPDGSKLYGVISPTVSPYPKTLYQWNVCASSPGAIIASRYTVGVNYSLPITNPGCLQRAIDGKIYMAEALQSLSVIHNPNLSGSAMGFSLSSINLSPKYSSLGLPNYINMYSRPNPLPFSSSISCQQVSFAAPALPSFSSGCSSTPYPPSGYLWNFGDPSSGTANTSTSSSPTHIYASLGTYTAQLIVYNACGNDTLSQVLNISNIGPVPSVAGPSLICKGDRYTYSASGGNTYNWSTGASTSTVSLNPTVTTVYTLTATQNGCSVAKVFTVNVNPCLGIEAQSQGAGFSLYPNPVQDVLKIHSGRACHLRVSDMQGREVLSQDLQAGENSLNTAGLAQGFYTLQFSDAGRTWWMKLVKVD
ncbi:MAG TPA: PKD domain-containing protein [Bacteroidia bacterium]|nr:PKD domain-containing protein [Bacteroidia bacterium]